MKKQAQGYRKEFETVMTRLKNRDFVPRDEVVRRVTLLGPIFGLIGIFLSWMSVAAAFFGLWSVVAIHTKGSTLTKKQKSIYTPLAVLILLVAALGIYLSIYTSTHP